MFKPLVPQLKNTMQCLLPKKAMQTGGVDRKKKHRHGIWPDGMKSVRSARQASPRQLRGSTWTQGCVRESSAMTDDDHFTSLLITSQKEFQRGRRNTPRLGDNPIDRNWQQIMDRRWIHLIVFLCTWPDTNFNSPFTTIISTVVLGDLGTLVSNSPDGRDAAGCLSSRVSPKLLPIT